MKSFVRQKIRSLGWDLHRITPATNAGVQLLAAINHVKTNLVFDVGANIGQFALEIRSAGFLGTIVSFEPLSEAHAQLSSTASQDVGWVVHPRVAVGDKDGEIDINISGNSVSSSVLSMLESHYSASANSAYVGRERVPLIRFDSVVAQYLSTNSRLFIKIDTQGFEWQVLDGMTETLKAARGVLLELSLVPLYDGQHLWLDIINRMEASGFTLWAIQKGFTDPRTGQTLQVDGVFLRQ